MNNYKMVNIQFTIKGFLGKARSGKTMSLVEFGYNTLLDIKEIEYNLKQKKHLNKLEKERLKILSNFELWSNLTLNKRIFGNYKLITIEKIIEIYENKENIENKIILLDDIFKKLDSRNFTKNDNKAFSYFITEIGKKKNILGYVSHFSSMVELRLRNFTEEYVFCRKGKYKILQFTDRNIYLWVDSPNYYTWDTPKEAKNIIIEQNYLNSYIDWKNDFRVLKEVTGKSYLDAYKIFKLYSTGEVI